MVFTPKNDGGVFVDEAGVNRSAEYVIAQLSAADRAALSSASGVYRRSANVGTTPGDGLLITGVTTAGTITITFADASTAIIDVPLKSSVLPFGATAVNMGTTGGTAKSLFFT